MMSYRQQFHLMPETGFLNDPNGLCRFDGEYHIFHQYAPEGLSGPRGWGHVSTRDFCTYHNDGMVLFPDTPFDRNGAYSGSALTDDGQLELFYTGNVRHSGDHDYITSGREQNLIHTVRLPDGRFSEKKLLMTNRDYPENCSCHVRDPKVWKENGRYKMVLGARTLDNRGEALVYDSGDKEHWTLEQVLTLPDTGYMWECPDLFSLGEKTFLCCCPQGMEPRGMEFHNIYQSGYFPLEQGKLLPFTEFDRGFDFYAPQTFQDGNGRRILIGWFGLPDVPYGNPSQEKEGWIHCLTLPRVLKEEGGRIIQEPLEELQGLRRDSLSLRPENGAMNILPDLHCELAVEFDKPTEAFTLSLRQDAILSLESGVLSLSLGASGFGRTRRSCPSGPVKQVRIFSDTSSLEIFVEGETFSTRLYESGDDTRLRFSVEAPTACTAACHLLAPFQFV